MLRWFAAILALLTGPTAAHAEAVPGARAPDFSLPGSDGRQHRLADLLGERGVVLAWFPKAFTPG